MSQIRTGISFHRISAAVAISVALAAIAAGPAQAQPTKVVVTPPGHVPVFERIEPTAGPVGTTIEIVGRRFHPGGQMFLGDVQLTVVRQLPNRVTVTVPPNAVTGRINYRQTRQGQAMRTDGPEFRVTTAAPAPVVERFEPL